MNKATEIDTVFVDCFNTIIFRKVKTKEVFIQWAKKLEQVYNINWKIIYKKYNSINFDLCFKKLFTSFTLQEQFDIVLENLFIKLSKQHKLINIKEFVSTATKLYVKTELEKFYLNMNLINYLKAAKSSGKKIYVVSDFYCKSHILSEWFNSLNIYHIFDKIYSSSDFEKEKATCKIYKHLLNALQLNPKNVIMLGDNLWSDIIMAKCCKLNVKRITPKTNLINKG